MSSRTNTSARLRAGAAMIGGLSLSAAMLWRWHDVASGEAWLNAKFVRATGIADTRAVGSAVVFPLDHRLVGFMVTTGCSVALLLIPPLLLAAFFLGVRRITVPRAAASAALAILLLVLVNQLRLAAVVGSMRLWGFEAGYERSHVLIGSAITTIGLFLVSALFIMVITTGGQPREAAHAA